MKTELYLLDLVGTFAFALYGSYYGIKHQCDILGIFIAAFLTAVGGGTMRDILLNRTPAYFVNKTYIIAIFFGIIAAILVYKIFHDIQRMALVLDAIGLVTFAFIGASLAYSSGLHSVFAITFFATISAVGGGVLRDVLLNRKPEIMYRDFYATTTIILGILYALFASNMSSFAWANALILICLIIRLSAIFFKINLWNPSKYINASQQTNE